MLSVDRVEHARGQRLERREDALACVRHTLERRHAVRVEAALELFHRHGVRKVTLVVLDDVRDRVEALAVLDEVLLQVLQRVQVLLEHRCRRVRDEDHAVHALQHELARRVVVDLTRYRIDLELGTHTGDRSEIQRHEVEEQRAISIGGDTRQVTTIRLGRALVHDLEVRRFARHAGTVINDFDVNRLLSEVDLNHA